jgi:hypothetical protein
VNELQAVRGIRGKVSFADLLEPVALIFIAAVDEFVQFVVQAAQLHREPGDRIIDHRAPSAAQESTL